MDVKLIALIITAMADHYLGYEFDIRNFYLKYHKSMNLCSGNNLTHIWSQLEHRSINYKRSVE